MHSSWFRLLSFYNDPLMDFDLNKSQSPVVLLSTKKQLMVFLLAGHQVIALKKILWTHLIGTQ